MREVTIKEKRIIRKTLRQVNHNINAYFLARDFYEKQARLSRHMSLYFKT